MTQPRGATGFELFVVPTNSLIGAPVRLYRRKTVGVRCLRLSSLPIVRRSTKDDAQTHADGEKKYRGGHD
jgi:hypothetical protein